MQRMPLLPYVKTMFFLLKQESYDTSLEMSNNNMTSIPFEDKNSTKLSNEMSEVQETENGGNDINIIERLAKDAILKYQIFIQ